MPIFRGKTAVSSYSDRKDSVRLASSVNINLSSSNVTTIDGVVLTHLDRILLFSQTAAQQNGIYVYRLGTRLSRAEDADQGAELTPGAKVFVEEGAINSQSDFVLSNIGTVTIGVTPLVFTKTGEVIELTNVGTYGSASQSVVITTNKSGQITAVTQTPILISNLNLLNNSITINGGSVPLGDEIILNTDDFQEGFNQYYTDNKVRAAIGVSGDLSYDSSTGIISYTAGETLPTQTGNTGKYLTTDGTTASWAQVDFASTLNQLTDVDTTGADNNYTLVYNTNSNTWLTSLSIANGTVIDGGNLDGPSGGSGVTTISDVHNIDELADVVVTNPTIDQVLKWNGYAWVNAATPTTLAGYGITDAATTAQGALADTALQSADLTGYATETYVNTAVSNLVDAAPGTLDTLNELAAALGDDANFATTTANSIALKANSADLGTASVQDVGYFATAAQGTLADSALQSADLTGYATETFVGTAISTASSDYATAAQGALADSALQSVTNDDINWIPYAQLVDLPSATDNHGMFAHVHATGKAYFAHAGAWVELANTSDLGTAAAQDVGYFATAAQGALADSALQSVAFADLGITDGTVGQVLTTDGAGSFTFADAGGSGGSGVTVSGVTVSGTAPSSPSDGDLWFDDTTTGEMYVYENGSWTSTGISATLGSVGDLLDVDITTTAPTDGQSLVWDNANSKFVPGDVDQSAYWVETSTTYDATVGSKTFVNTTTNAVQVNLPASPVMGDEVYVVDAAGNSGTYNITINRNGKKITGLDEDFTIDVNGAAIILAYYNATRGWIVISK